MGFKATEAVEELTYDFNPHANAAGTIPEPTTAQIEHYRDTVFMALKASGLAEQMQAGEQEFNFDRMDELLQKTSEVEAQMVAATADLTGLDAGTLAALPYRVKAAFLGWIMGQFFSPEA